MHVQSHHHPDLPLIARLQKVEKAALVVGGVIAGSTIAMWLWPTLAVHAPDGWMALRFATAVGLLLALTSLALSTGYRPWARIAGIVVGLVLLFIPLIVLATYAGLRPLHPEWWPVRPPPSTAVAVAISALGVVLVRQTGRPLKFVADACAIFLGCFVLYLLGGALFHGHTVLGVEQSTLSVPQTLLCLSMIAFVMLSRRAADRGILSIFVGTGIGSQIARRVLPGMIALPFVLMAGLIYLDRIGVTMMEYSRSAMGPIIVLGTIAVMALMARHTNVLEERLRRQSLTDDLTGVLNKRGFDTVAEYVIRNAERSKTRLIAFFFDLDGLKRANDDLGHEAGSLVIQRFADLLVVTFRKSDVVARIGGDEFVILAPALPESANDILARLTRVVDVCNASGLVPRPISYSVGHAELPPEGGRLEDLVAEADARMYAEKSRKRAA
jgi:diguanylate cyclase (GGDEF)-like protein